MKQTNNFAISLRYFCIVVLVLTFACTTVNASAQTGKINSTVSQSAIDEYLASQNNTDMPDEERIKSAIETYFTLRYESQKTLQEQDYSKLLEDSSQNWVNKENEKREIELYIASLFNLRYLQYDFTLEYDSIEVKNNLAIVQLKENHQVIYEVTNPEVSELANQIHTITLHSKNGIWLIYKDEYHDEYSDLLKTYSKEMIKQQVDENYESAQIGEQYSSRTDSNVSESSSTLALPSYSYNRSAANTFSYNNALITNTAIPTAIKNAYQATYGVPYPGTWPTVYTNEDANGGDCTNFASEAVFEGTGYTSGDPSYFNPSPNDSNWYYKFALSPKGSTTWINVGWFHDYLVNTSTSKRGPYGVDVGSSSLCTSINPGDPIFMKQGSSWAHTVIVYSKSSPCTSPSYIRVNSHNSYRRNEPLTTWSGFSWFGVYIQGYRK